VKADEIKNPQKCGFFIDHSAINLADG